MRITLKIVSFFIASFFVFILMKSCEKKSEEEKAIEGAKEAKSQAEREIEKNQTNLIFNGERQIISKLKDGASATFSNVFISTSDFVCGNVNSKNSFGGYSGYQRFISAYPSDVSALEENTNTRDFKKTWDKFCNFKKTFAYVSSEHSH